MPLPVFAVLSHEARKKDEHIATQNAIIPILVSFIISLLGQKYIFSKCKSFAFRKDILLSHQTVNTALGIQKEF
jgi:hypothetical protein